MAWVASAIAVVGIGVSVASSQAASKASAKQAAEQIASNTYEGQLQNNLKKVEAEESLKAAKAQADKIKAAAAYARGSQSAQMAGAGVLTGEGSAMIMQDRTSELAISDALAALYSGAHGASAATIAGQFAQQTSNMRAAGAALQNESNQTAIAYNTAASVLSQAGSAYSAYKKASTVPSTTSTTTTSTGGDK